MLLWCCCGVVGVVVVVVDVVVVVIVVDYTDCDDYVVVYLYVDLYADRVDVADVCVVTIVGVVVCDGCACMQLLLMMMMLLLL